VPVRFGTDEAGKGPVLGSMFAACVRGDPGALPAVDDSKRLPPDRRDRLAREIREGPFAVGLAEIPVARIDGAEDMNSLTVAAHAEALSGVARDGDRGLADAGDTDADRFARRVAGAAGPAVELSAEHGADGADPLVAAASIVAKVARDDHVAALAAEYDRAIGSGYPSDPTTRAFLRAFVREHDRLPECARASWATARDVLAAAEQSDLAEF
jgi:ribonuclease HII